MSETEPACGNTKTHSKHLIASFPLNERWCEGEEGPPTTLPDPRPDPEQKYTLDEAKQILAIQECTRRGHELEVLLTNGGIPTTVVCMRCPGRWGVTQSSQAK